MHYMVNNPEMKYPNVLLHVNLTSLILGQDAVSFYKLNESFDKALDGVVI